MSKIHQAIRRAETDRARNQGWDSRSPKTRIDPTPGDLPPLNSSASSLGEPAVDSSLQNLEPTPPLSVGRVFEIASHPKLAALVAPRSLAGEQYRALMGRLCRTRGESSLRSILITSAAASDGKTLSAANLALTLGQETDERVLLIDANTRNPSLHRILGLPLRPGLADFLKGEVKAGEIILQTDLLGLAVVPAGQTAENSAGLLNTQAMRDFMEEVVKNFDWVIVDLPAVVLPGDAQILSSLVDGVLLVVRSGKTPADQITKCMAALKGKRLLGVVFNCVKRVGWSLSFALRLFRTGAQAAAHEPC